MALLNTVNITKKYQEFCDNRKRTRIAVHRVSNVITYARIRPRLGIPGRCCRAKLLSRASPICHFTPPANVNQALGYRTYGDSLTFIFLGTKACFCSSGWKFTHDGSHLFSEGRVFKISLDEAYHSAQSAMLLEHGRNRKVRSWEPLE
jgi:hypothetical protein